jgi:hypothetical protein
LRDQGYARAREWQREREATCSIVAGTRDAGCGMRESDHEAARHSVVLIVWTSDTDLSGMGASGGRGGDEGGEAEPSVRGCAGLGAGERGGTGPDTSVERGEGAAGFGRGREVPCGGEAVLVGCREVGGFVVEGWPAGFQGSVLPIVAKTSSKGQKLRTVDQIKSLDEIAGGPQWR